MEKLQFVLDNWVAIVGLISAVIAVMVSPFLILKRLRSKNEIAELTTQFQKDDLIRVEIKKINDELTLHQKRISELEKKLLDSELEVIRLTSENKDLTIENEELKLEISDLKNP